MPGQGHATDPDLFEDGRLHKVTGYTTDLLTDRAVSFIQRERGSPFLMYLAHKAAHPDVVQRDDGSMDPESDRGYVPAPRHEGRYRDRIFTRREPTSDIEEDLAGKPVVRQALARLSTAADPQTGGKGPSAYPSTNEETIRRRAEMILAVDESLGRIMATLDSLELLDKTVIVFSSDNGFFFGEHGLTTERRLPYEESIRNPLLIRYPPRIPAGSRPKGLALTVDLAPTVLDLAGVPIGPSIQGHSLVPLVRGTPAGWRQAVLIEFYANEKPFAHLMDIDYRAIRTDRHKYIYWIKHPEQDELYDLQSDPLERRNRTADPALAPIKTSLRTELSKLVLEAMGLHGGRVP
jgi:N-acetylglucosamine-6-sulfatase